MAEMMATAAATSVMGSVIGKLAAMLTAKYKLAKEVERGIRFLHEERSTMDAGVSKANFVRKAMRKVKTLFKDGGIAEEVQELESLVSEQNERGKRYYDINQCLAASAQPVLLDPQAPALFQEASDLWELMLLVRRSSGY
ncbi:uncharacterized protein [Miscanthus floridulus]|uniref:uncharacterized protein n=1 Tax=Miscanthus floridulus TaxID=154761 RepID=UPI003457A347